jgi:hypothetical protein
MHLYRLARLLMRLLRWLCRFAVCVVWDHKRVHWSHNYGCTCGAMECMRCGHALCRRIYPP